MINKPLLPAEVLRTWRVCAGRASDQQRQRAQHSRRRVAKALRRASGATSCDRLGPPGKGLRRAYVTHLTEDGADRRFLQEQVGRRCDTSTAIYTHVSGDFMNTALRRAIGPALGAPGSSKEECDGTQA